MTVPGRFIVRLASYFAYGFTIVASIILFLSDIKLFHAIGLLAILFLLERLIHFGRPERLLTRVSLKEPNIRAYLSPETQRVIEVVFDRTNISGGSFPLHLLAELVRRPEVRKSLVRLGVNPDEFETKTESYLKVTVGKKIEKTELLRLVNRIVVSAFVKATKHYEASVTPQDLFGALGELGDEQIKKLFVLFDMTPSDVETAFIFARQSHAKIAAFAHHAHKQRHRIMNRAWSARPTPFLDTYSTDLTDLARTGGAGFLIGHEDEYQRLVSVLSRPGNPNALLIGDPGCGKETVVAHLAFQLIKDRVPKQLFDRRLVSLSVTQLAAGASDAELSGRVKKVLDEIIIAGNIILYIPDIHELLKTSGERSFSGADILIPAIKSTEFSVIGGTYPREYKQLIVPSNDFASSFEPIQVEELTPELATQYLVYASLVLEVQSKLIITFSAIKQAVKIAHTYFHQKLLPASAEDLLKETIAAATIKHKKVVTADDVISTAELKVNVKIHTASSAEADELLHLEDTIHKRFVDQNEAVKDVSDALRAYRSGLARKGGPIASFLFIGPTGVGKTELSKILADTQFGSKDAMARFDMSEYQDKQSFFRLIGSPDGVTRGALTEAVLEKPYSLILLDEFEKAYPDILNLFLQVLDDGRLTDNVGRTVDFQNAIIIATSNAHSTLIKEELEKGTDIKEIADILKKRLTEYFRPELINRFSNIVVFKPLSKDDIAKVARLNLAELAKAMSEAQAVDLVFEDSAVQAIATIGYDPVFGARPLRAAINEKLRAPLAEQILKSAIVRGGTITVKFDGTSFIFEAK